MDATSHASYAGLIDAIRDQIELRRQPGDFTDQEAHVLITSLLFAVDKVANTVGQYDAYAQQSCSASYSDSGRHVVDSNAYSRLRMRMPDLLFETAAKVVKADVNAVASGSRRRCSLLRSAIQLNASTSNVITSSRTFASWEKPALSARTMKFERTSALRVTTPDAVPLLRRSSN